MPERIRVLFAIGSLGGGGAERQTINYLRHLDRSRFLPLLYLHYRRGELLSEVPEDVPVLSFWDRHCPPRWNYPGRIYRMQVRDLAGILAEHQVDVLCAVTFLLTLVASSAAKHRPTPWLAIEMADPRLDFTHQVARFRWIKRWLLVRAYRRASFAVAVSAGVREALIERYAVTPDKTVVIPNFIDLDQVDRMAQGPRPEGFEKDLFQIVSVGRLDLQKGHIYLLQALEDVIHRRGQKQLRLHLLGQGPLEPQLKRYVQEHGLADFVHFAGFVRNPLPYVKACRLFCLPSLYEGLPLALLEAIACQTPVLATDCPSGPREILGGGCYGRLVPPADARALADAIADAVACYDQWCQPVAAAREHVEHDFSLTKGVRATENVLWQAWSTWQQGHPGR